MINESSHKLYKTLRVRPVINATGGHMTLLGGSTLSPTVTQAMADANRYYVDMEELLDSAGQIIAELLGAEAAYVTSGCCAALALGTAACMAGSDPDKIEALPDVRGMRHEVIVQKGLRSKYDRCVTVPGARLIEVGDPSGTRADQVEAAIGERTAAIHYLAPSRQDGVVPLKEVVRIGKQYSLPTIVDAAGQVYPVENMRKYTAMGVDLVCFGAKYFGAPNSTGILCGRRDLVEAAALHGFIAFESNSYRTLGRPMKLDRQEIIAAVVALREWLTMDHKARFESYERRVRRLQEGLEEVPHIEVTPQGDPITGLCIALDEGTLVKGVKDISKALQEGDPSIWVHSRENTIAISVVTLLDGDELVIADRLRRLLSNAGTAG